MGEKLNWPPGYRFKPTDEELICYYLKRRILRQKLYCDIIKDRELYGPKCTPWDLFDVHDNSWIVFKDKPTEKIVYVFTTLSKLRKTDDVRSRENTCKKAGCGTWVGQNKKPIKDGMGNLIGEKRMLVFEITEIGVEFDRSKAGYFKMHEYSLSGVNKGFGSTAGDDFVLCKITFDSAKKLTYKLGLKSDVEICGEGQKKEQIMKNLEHTVCDNLEETGNLPSQSEGSVCGNFEGSECLTSENLVVLDSGISNYDYLLDNCYVAATQECNIAAPECNELCGDPGFDMDLLIDLLTNDQEEGPKDSNALGKRKFEEEENLSREQSNLSRHGANGLCKWPFPYVTVLQFIFGKTLMAGRRDMLESLKQKLWIIEPRPLNANNMQTSPVYGGGLCVEPSGLILTAAQVVTLPNFEQEDCVIRARACKDVGFTRSVQLVAKLPQFDLALLKVSKEDDEVLDFVLINEGVKVEAGVRAFVYGHAHRLFYSYLFGHTCYPFPDNVLLPEMTDETTMTSSGLLLERKRRPTSMEKYRTVAPITDMSDVEFHHLHPKLPLVQASGLVIGPGLSGCPLFDYGSGKLIGLCTIQKYSYQFAIPVNLLGKFVDHVQNSRSLFAVFILCIFFKGGFFL
ncbi:hypothetical protein POM88_023369 [Heracleum sosnowskyi]|uniref:NAC domain-containing protein n=1 Tax=Heracleum sosnowskyi TaxID=360622 RepID=A0AAD8IIK8_9APIA|nr:hypothetical protein POM88_023369 [Heracleum sosnowskyi]